MKKCSCRGKDNLFGGDFLSEMKILIFVKRDSLEKNLHGEAWPGSTRGLPWHYHLTDRTSVDLLE